MDNHTNFIIRIHMKLKIITPKKVVREAEIDSITAPSAAGEITVLPKHENLFTLLKEGILTMRTKNEEEYMAIGGGYLETDGENLQILVSRAYGQDEIDEEITQKALDNAQKVIEENKDQHEVAQASAMIRRSLLDLKLLRKRRKAV